MLEFFMYIFEVKKELLVGFSLTVLYITYYLVEAVKKPTLICRKGEFREFLEESVPLLSERYWPTPWCVEARLQTVLGSLLRSSLLPAQQYRREVLRLADGGQLALDWAEPSPRGPAPVLLVLPGLTGDAGADYARCLAAAAAALRARCVVVNYRGLGGLPLTTPRLYCALSHADLGEVVAALRAREPGPLLAAGVSLGGLVLGHYLAEWGERAGVAAALVVSSPLDVVRGAECIERPPLNALLSYHMARNMRRAVGRHARLRAAAALDWAAVERSRSVREFDAAFTTKHFGFGSVEAYYREASLGDKLHRVRVPLLCLCAADDPFQPLDGECTGGRRWAQVARWRGSDASRLAVRSDPGARGGGQRARGAGGDGSRRPHRLPGGLVAGRAAARAVHCAPGLAVLRGAAAARRPATRAARARRLTGAARRTTLQYHFTYFAILSQCPVFLSRVSESNLLFISRRIGIESINYSLRPSVQD